MAEGAGPVVWGMVFFEPPPAGSGTISFGTFELIPDHGTGPTSLYILYTPGEGAELEGFGIASEEAFGTPQINQRVFPAGIASAEAFGTFSTGWGIFPFGIASGEAFGEPSFFVDELAWVPLGARLNLYDLIPPGVWRLDAANQNQLRQFVEGVLAPVLTMFDDEADRWTLQIDPDVADANAVDAMIWDLGGAIFEDAFALPLARRRLLVRTLLEGWKLNGTEDGLRAFVRALTGIEITVISPADVSFWILGEHVLADSQADPEPNYLVTDIAVLGPAPTFMRYSFQVEVDRVLTADERVLITKVVRKVKPAHTHFLGILEPGGVFDVDPWEIGLSDLDEDTDLH